MSGSTNAIVAQQWLDAGFPPTEGAKQLCSIAGATLFKNFATEAVPGFRVENAGFFKSTPGVGRKHFGPFVTVVTRCIATGENMAETILEAVEVNLWHHRNCFADLVEQPLYVSRRGCAEFMMQAQIKQREL